MANKFKQYSDRDIVDLVREYPLASMVSCSDSDFTMTSLPMLPVTDDDGRLVELVGHMALRNPHTEELQRQPRARFLFRGPDSYISPNLLRDRNWAPTWNFATVCIEADVVFTPDKNHQALQSLVAEMEKDKSDPWSTDELGARYDTLARQIISFVAEVRSIDATFKLGQDEKRDAFGQILEGIDSGALKRWMQRLNREPD